MLFQIQLKDFLDEVARIGAEKIEREDLGKYIVYYLTIPRHPKIYFTVIPKGSGELKEAEFNLSGKSITGARLTTNLFKLNKSIKELIENAAENKPSD